MCLLYTAVTIRVKSLCDSYSCNRAHPIVLGARRHLWCATRTRRLLRASSHPAESLSTAIIPSKTSAVIPAMFHQSAAVYSKALCRSTLGSAGIIACQCFDACVRVHACVCLLFFFSFSFRFTRNLSSFLWTNTGWRKQLSRQLSPSPALFHSSVCVCVRICVYMYV